ncbi:pantetheine-phosphate adenylyltransferase [Eubacterium xylanophilum]|uniref:pantetheine-phosphate adenylyltransferase n=1 Tax=Eubacterium xylanophilum TaxID=39497 RepID=UPI0004B8C562|nr:pantetheine-phosphate adenylyltransferase [Eubacterium xylanophilum]
MKAIFPGSFDPITLGHLDLIERGSTLYDELIVVILENNSKNPMFSIEERITMIEEATSHLDNVRVDTYSGLTVDYCKDNGIHCMLRGLRNDIDFEYEKQLETINHRLSESVETVFLMTRAEHFHISSSAVKELLLYKQDVDEYVPQAVVNHINH